MEHLKYQIEYQKYPMETRDGHGAALHSEYRVHLVIVSLEFEHRQMLPNYFL